ncbi:cytochrome P450 [Micromonospora haikouensis]|uniref:cytochrome P450 n=1 Tax=Micromonospora haikouensis TaxID=686309 RepID=UPI003793ED7F
MPSQPAAQPDADTTPPLDTPTPELDFPQFDRPGPFDPPEAFTELRGRCPVAPAKLPSGQTSWLLTSFEGVRTALSDPRFSSDMSRPGFPNLYAKPVDPVLKGTFIRMDGEDHMFYRRMLIGEFSVKRVEAMRPVVTRITDEALDRLTAAGPGADLVEHVALVVPSRVICHVLGVPHSDHASFADLLQTLFDASSDRDQINAAKQGLVSYLDNLVTDREQHDRDDLLGRLVRGHLVTGELTRQEVLTIAWMLLAAGHETTAHMIGLGTAALLRHPDQLDLLRREPQLLPRAVDELLRYLTVMQLGMTRVAVADAEVDGRTVAAGEGVVALLALANRDPAVFERPDELDIRRDARRHLAFGYGPHQCLGHTLARLELEVVFGRLLERFPALRLADGEADLELRREAIVYGVSRLAVDW